MSHRAALYSVRIRQTGQSDVYELLGNYDRHSTWLGDTIANMMPSLNVSDVSRDVGVRYESALHFTNSDYIGTSLLAGRSGINSIIQKPGEAPFLRTHDHSEVMRSAILFDLPRLQRIGFAVVHVPHRNGRKTLIEEYLRKNFAAMGFSLELTPFVPQDALRQAVDNNEIERVTLVKHDLAPDNEFASAAQWGSFEVGRIELAIPSRRNRRLRRDPIKQFLDDPTDENRRQIIEFAGLSFDEVKVTACMPDGSHRTFLLENHEGGHPMTTEINIDVEDDIGATSAELRRELQNALTQMRPPP